MNNLCPCGSKIDYEHCCEPFIIGKCSAPTAEKLMRSRYSAYVKKNIDYLFRTLHPDARADFDAKATQAWAERTQWTKLEILNADNKDRVEFIASYIENDKHKKHHEISIFKKEAGCWYYVGQEKPEYKTLVRTAPKIGRNDPCPCGSGKKYKKCCDATK